ncbi:MAG: anaerobic ribonucleoside-triphosphate reductase activating protein [Thermoprotei archaeon]|nr:MAG: anaerobic ribonucleoside-triphosphate reductase activating protein [Thermoprotei archaeon]
MMLAPELLAPQVNPPKPFIWHKGEKCFLLREAVEGNYLRGSIEVRIGGLVDLSTVDWPSKLCSVVFFSGCNFRCPFCQNAKLIDPSYGKLMSVSDLVKLVERGKPLIEGVVITGGECTLQLEGLVELCRALKERGLGVGIDTNGSNPKAIERLLEEKVVDRVAIDVKAPLKPEVYERVVGLPGHGNEVVTALERSLDALLRSPIEVEVRTLIVPGLVDQPEQVKEVAKRVKGCTRLVLQQFRPEAELLDPSFKSIKAPERVLLLALAKVALREGIENVCIRTKEGGLERVRRVSA